MHKLHPIEILIIRQELEELKSCKAALVDIFARDDRGFIKAKDIKDVHINLLKEIIDNNVNHLIATSFTTQGESSTQVQNKKLPSFTTSQETKLLGDSEK